MRILTVFAPALAACALLFLATPAAAQTSPETWVSGTGVDNLTCTRTAPCRTLTNAMNRATAGGKVTCLDAITFNTEPGGAVTIQKSITVDCEQGTFGRISTAARITVLLNSSTVHLRGLQLDGGSVDETGIVVVGSGKLFLDHVTIRNFVRDAILVTAGGANRQIYITDSVIANNRNSSAGGGIHVGHVAGATSIMLTRTQIIGNTSAGIRLKAPTNAANTASVKLRDSTISGNGNGVVVTAPAGGGSASVSVQDSEVARNGTYGLAANGPLGQIVVGNSVVTGNAVGVFAADGGAMVSAGNNGVNGNGYDGAFTSSVAPQ
jgi:hypothetical protein